MKRFKCHGMTCTIHDLALIELANSGSTDAPSDILQTLKDAGRITLKSGKPALTAEGRIRAARLKDNESTLRTFFAGGPRGDGRMTTTAAKPGMKITGGSARIHG